MSEITHQLKYVITNSKSQLGLSLTAMNMSELPQLELWWLQKERGESGRKVSLLFLRRLLT